jgi:hypothetical protein
MPSSISESDPKVGEAVEGRNSGEQPKPLTEEETREAYWAYRDAQRSARQQLWNTDAQSTTYTTAQLSVLRQDSTVSVPASESPKEKGKQSTLREEQVSTVPSDNTDAQTK